MIAMVMLLWRDTAASPKRWRPPVLRRGRRRQRPRGRTLHAPWWWLTSPPRRRGSAARSSTTAAPPTSLDARVCPGPAPHPAASGCPCRSRVRVSILEVWLPRTTVRPRPSRSTPLGTCASTNSSRSTNVRTARSTPPTCPPARMSAETSAMRRSPRAGPCRPRPQTRRYACQFARLASTSSVGAWTPCAASSAAVDAVAVGGRAVRSRESLGGRRPRPCLVDPDHAALGPCPRSTSRSSR